MTGDPSNYFYFFSPFPMKIMSAVIKNIRNSLTRNPRKVTLIYCNPECHDAVVTDWRLGDGNGRAVVQAAKSHSTMPVVVVSGYVAEAFQAAEPLADLYLEKPVNPEELVTIVNELLKTSDKKIGG